MLKASDRRKLVAFIYTCVINRLFMKQMGLKNYIEAKKINTTQEKFIKKLKRENQIIKRIKRLEIQKRRIYE